jgi:WhiB family transcriptional regulator, redox-sensing transcriptional regulator
LTFRLASFTIDFVDRIDQPPAQSSPQLGLVSQNGNLFRPSSTSIVDATWNNRSWRQYAACAQLDTNLFFPNGLTGDAIDQINLAKTVCSDCPVSRQCLEFALRTLQDYGVWGGRSEEERRVIRRARRAAARKAAAGAKRVGSSPS